MDGTDCMDDKTDFFPGDLETVDADLADRMDETSTRLAARMADIRSRYLATRRDRDVETELKLLIGNASVSVDGHQDERRCLAVMGETGAGKTTLIKRAIAARTEFRPRVTGMTETAPITFIQAPRPSSLLLVAYEILEALDYPLERNLKPAAAWRLVRRQLKTRKVRFLHIDEAQHMLNMRDHEAMQELSDALKMVMEDAAWPVSLILTGLPELGDFLAIYRQLARRSHKIHLKNLVFPKDAEMVSWMVRTIVEEHARMTFAFDWDESFLARLCHAANRQFGALIQIVRVAVERAFVENIDATEVRKEHFVQSYGVFSGCQPDENIISARSWEGIEPMNALLREQEANYLRLLQALAERERELRDRRLGRKKKAAN